MQNIILYQAYGSADNINECRYSLLKFLQIYNLIPPANVKVVIYSDQPAAFESFAAYIDLYVQQITPEEIQKWRGEFDFVHRVKIEIIRDAFQHFDGNLLYCDTDTYIINRAEEIFNDIEKGIFCMHEYEGVLDKKANPAFEKWIKFLSSTAIEFNQKKLVISPQTRVWNAGVIGMNSRSANTLDDVLSLTDALYSKFPKHIAEQLAFSYCLQKEGYVKSVSSDIAHYWNLKEFRTLLKEFFLVHGEESTPNLVKMISNFDAATVQDEKIKFRSQSLPKKMKSYLTGKAWKIEKYRKKLHLS